MQDLDFEELDKAVNSLMPQPSDDSNNIKSTSATVSDVAVNQNPALNQPTANLVSSLNLINRPSTGRFMDVVHPSSDMRASLNIPQRTSSPPLVSQPAAPVAAIQTTEVKPVDKPDMPISNTENWAGLPNYQSSVSNTPAESPFLPDTKVEKRPLGAFSDDVKSVQPTIETDKTQIAEIKNTDEDITETPKVETSVITPNASNIPAELDSSILNIEASSSTSKNDVDMKNNPLSYTPSVSINQQYKEKPVLDKPVNGSIYDTSSYNTASSVPVKKKSSWMIVIWIIILLIIGVGSGLAFYTFMPNLKLPF